MTAEQIVTLIKELKQNAVKEYEKACEDTVTLPFAKTYWNGVSCAYYELLEKIKEQ